MTTTEPVRGDVDKHIAAVPMHENAKVLIEAWRRQYNTIDRTRRSATGGLRQRFFCRRQFCLVEQARLRLSQALDEDSVGNAAFIWDAMMTVGGAVSIY